MDVRIGITYTYNRIGSMFFLFITQDDDVLTNIDYELGERER